MSTLIRWEPAREMVTLREAMDRLFDDAFTRPLSLAGMQAPAIDMYQTDDEIVVKATLPGVKSDEVQISITGEMLSIKGEYKEKSETKEKAYHLREQRYGSFERTLSLPTEVVSDKAKAEFEDGILTITLPKAKEVKPKTITIKAKQPILCVGADCDLPQHARKPCQVTISPARPAAMFSKGTSPSPAAFLMCAARQGTSMPDACMTHRRWFSKAAVGTVPTTAHPPRMGM